jgi:hypothetical protein
VALKPGDRGVVESASTEPQRTGYRSEEPPPRYRIRRDESIDNAGRRRPCGSDEAAAPARGGQLDLQEDWRLLREREGESYRWPNGRE